MKKNERKAEDNRGQGDNKEAIFLNPMGHKHGEKADKIKAIS